MPANSVQLVGETTLSELKTRPDFAVTVGKALVGFVEVKAPGKGADPRKFNDPHDKDQWDKLKSLPNLIYTDGNAFSLWRDGKAEGAIVHLEGDIESAGAKLDAPTTLLPLISDFLRWAPIPPKNAKQLAQVSARLCRLLRDEVIEQMTLGSPALSDVMEYDSATRRLKIGKGYVENVTPEMWAYEVSDMQVLWHWFSYRRRDRSRPIIGDRRPPSPLDSIQPDHWLPEYTSDLLDLLHVLGRLIALEPKQADLLQRICGSPLLSADELRNAGALTHLDDKPAATKGKSKSKA